MGLFQYYVFSFYGHNLEYTVEDRTFAKLLSLVTNSINIYFELAFFNSIEKVVTHFLMCSRVV
jgi:hypothetical protein